MKDGGALPPTRLSTATAAGAGPAAAPSQGGHRPSAARAETFPQPGPWAQPVGPAPRSRRCRSAPAAGAEPPTALLDPAGNPREPLTQPGPSDRTPRPTWLNLSTMPRQVEHAKRRRSPAPLTGSDSSRAPQSSTAKTARGGRGAGPGRGEGPGPMARARDPGRGAGPPQPSPLSSGGRAGPAPAPPARELYSDFRLSPTRAPAAAARWSRRRSEGTWSNQRPPRSGPMGAPRVPS